MTDPTGPTGPIEPTGPTEPASPAIPAPEDDRVAVLAAYLRSNQGKFTDQALDKAAREAGYSEAELAAARPLANPSWQGSGVMPPPTRDTHRGVVAAVAIAYVLVLYLLISTAASMSSDLSGTVGLVGLLAGIVAWALLRNERPSLAQGIGCGVVLAVVIPIVAIFVIIGICVVTGTFPSS
jgi:hypothetical protein